MFSGKISYDAKYLRELYIRSHATLFEMAAPSYLHSNPLIRFIVNWRMRCAISFLDLAEGKNLLDFGCGAGILFLQLPRDGRKYHGVDLEIWPAQQMLAHHGRTDVELLKTDTWLTKIADASLDNITALEVLEHVEDLPGSVSAFKRKLISHGRLIVSGPTENKIYELARKISGFTGEYHVRNIFEIQKALEKAGFVCIKLKKLPLPGPFCLFVVAQYRLSDEKNEVL